MPRTSTTPGKRKRASSDDDFSHEISDELDAYEPSDDDFAKKSSRRVTSNAQKMRAKKSKGARAKPEETVTGRDVPSHSTSRHTLKPESLPALREALVDWYDSVHEVRGMPWRKPFNSDFDAEQRAQRAYEVWISEIMLQQTQVTTVIPYYNKWMAKFPTIRDLAFHFQAFLSIFGQAVSDIDTVNSLWKGLGYYSRAARLLAGAKKVVEDFGGRLPDTAKDLQTHIPGIGRYSAGAISSIAYNECAPVLDGNVTRLMSRVLALHANPKAKSTLDILWSGAEAVIKKTSRPGDLNQALIELGSTICKPREPDCERCPLRLHCQAHLEVSARTVTDILDIEDLCEICEPFVVAELGVVRYPMKVEKKKAREETDVVSVVEWKNEALPGKRWFVLVRRPDEGLLAGLYEFPSTPKVDMSISVAAVRRRGHEKVKALVSDSLSPSGSEARDCLRIERVVPAGDVLHIFSHIRKTYRVQWIVLCGGGDPGTASPPALADPASKWVLMDDIAHANIGTGVMKIWKKANEAMD